jgi:hypothetical protein
VLGSLRKGRDKALTWLNGKPLVTAAGATDRRLDARRTVIHGLWRETVPKYTLLWLSEPDAAQHQTSSRLTQRREETEIVGS